MSKAAVRAAVERSLTRMQTERLELLQFHTWNYADPSWLDCLFYLQELQEEGLIAHLGLTNFNTAHLSVVVSSGIEVVSNQVCFSLLDQRASHEMTALCLEHDIKLLAYGTVRRRAFNRTLAGPTGTRSRRGHLVTDEIQAFYS